MGYLLLYFNTLRFLKMKQLFYQILYRFRKVCLRLFNLKCNVVVSNVNTNNLKLLPWIPKYCTLSNVDEFTFINKTSPFLGWNDEYNGKLWSYNLNYMDYLLQENLSFEEGKGWIMRYIEDMDDNLNGLESYPIALRGINWIKFLVKYNDRLLECEKKKIDTFLYMQYLILFNNIEYHLLGNHLLENAFSLLWGGLYFGDKKIYDKSFGILRVELQKQILEDGGHCELSPMYHEILLDRLLDCINLLKHNIIFSSQQAFLPFLEVKAGKMLSWLEAIIYRDGSIPLFNDSANKIAPVANDIFNYAMLLGLSWKKICLKESGYRKMISKCIEAIVDVGKIGADYIPGHAHADTFNFELRINGIPFIVDTGISTYNKNERRQYERGTTAHNTICIDEMNTSEVWGGFRVANRASVLLLKDLEESIVGVHDGYRKRGIDIQRSYTLKDDTFHIVDKIISKKKCMAVCQLILDPNVIIVAIDSTLVKTSLGVISFNNVNNVRIKEVLISKEYNSLLPTKMICFSFISQMSLSIRPN